MTIAFYMDEQVPKPITLGLRKRGIDVLTVQDVLFMQQSHYQLFKANCQLR